MSPAVCWHASPHPEGAGTDAGQGEPRAPRRPGQWTCPPWPPALRAVSTEETGRRRAGTASRAPTRGLGPPSALVLPPPLPSPAPAPAPQPCSGRRPPTFRGRSGAGRKQGPRPPPRHRRLPGPALPLPPPPALGSAGRAAAAPRPRAAALVSWGGCDQGPQSDGLRQQGGVSRFWHGSPNQTQGPRCRGPRRLPGRLRPAFSSFRWPQVSLGLRDLCLPCHVGPSLSPLSLLLFEGHRSLAQRSP